MTTDEAYEKYQEQLQIIYQQYECDCSSMVAVRRRISDGRIMVYEQCRRCGKSPKSLKSANFDIDSLPWFDECRVEQFYAKRRQACEIVRAKYDADLEQIQQETNTQWWQRYNQYLHSQQWYDIRKRVLERDGNICQACLKNKASQVHHTSYALYEQLGRSAAFELIAICYQCHKAIHPHMAEAQHDLVLYNPYMNGVSNGRR